jgi:hypothetical protein
MMAKVRRRSTSAASGVWGMESAAASGLFMPFHVAANPNEIKRLPAQLRTIAEPVPEAPETRRTLPTQTLRSRYLQSGKRN